MLAHEEPQKAATVYFGPARLAGYAVRLRAWAGTYRQRGWPADTPDYLIGGFIAAELTQDDIPVMIELSTDRQRQYRMAELAVCLRAAAATPTAVAGASPDLGPV